MRNMGSIVSAHNQRLLTPDKSSFGSNKSVEHKCLTQKVIHQADVTNDVDNEYKFYYGLTESLFKEGLETIPNLYLSTIPKGIRIVQIHLDIKTYG